MMKRILAVLVAAVMLLGALPALTFAEDAFTVEMNVALGKSVTSPQGVKNGVTNGSVSDTLAYSQDPWMAAGDDSTCWVMIDLGQAYDLDKIKVVNWYGDSRYYHWEAYASLDAALPFSGWTKIAEKKDSVVSTSSGTTYSFETVSARYVKVFGVRNSANTGFHFAEIEVYAMMPFETQTWTVGGLTVRLDETGALTVNGSGALPGYSSNAARPWNEYAAFIKSVTVGSGVTSIGSRAFADCQNLISVDLQSTVTSIGSEAFSSCGQLSTVNCGEALLSIGDKAFYSCVALDTITLPSTLKSLGENAFSGAVLSTVDCPKTQGDLYAGLTTCKTGNVPFWSAVWTADPVGITNGVVDGKIKWSVQNGALTVSGSGETPDLDPSLRPWRNFTNQITKVIVGSGITKIGRNSFARMTRIEDVYLPDGLTVLMNDAFAYCSSIDHVRLPSSVTHLYQGVFYSTSVGVIECALTHDDFVSALALKGPYNNSLDNAEWVSEGGYTHVTNLSRGIVPEVSAGSNAACITDGSKSGAFWDGGVAPAEIVIDLGSGAFISSINVVTYNADGRYYHYEIYLSTDGRNYTLAAEKNNDAPASASGEDYVFAEPLYGRYVEVVLTYNSANASVHLHEVTVMGELDPDYVEPIPTDGDQDDPDNIAYGKPVRSALGHATVARVTDGSTASYWTGDYFPTYVDIDLLEEYDLDDIVVCMPVRSGRYYYYTVYGSNDLRDFERLYQKRSTDPATDGGDVIPLGGRNFRFIRVYVEYVSGSGAAYISEVRAHGTPTGANTGEVRRGSIDEIMGIADFDTTEYAAPITANDTYEALYGLVERTVGAQYRSWFTFRLADPAASGNDFYTVSNENGKILITGNTGVCMAAGLNYYYKYYCGVEISEQARQTRMPASIVPVEGTVRRETPYKVRYAFNYCTLDYSLAFFGEEDFVRENDWLALCGVNVVLDLAGQEAVWIKFLGNFGYTVDEAKDWIAGPSYYAWQFMDNLETFGGPVSDGWVIDRLEMARRTQRFKRSLGIDTVLQGYAGMIPTNFTEYQDVTVLKQGGWCGLSRPDMIRTDGALYDEYAALFYEAQRWALGETSNYYAVDPFHEGGIRPSDLSDETIAAQVLESLLSYDPDAVWMVQAWWSNPTTGLLRGMGENRQDHVIILDLTADKWNTLTYGGTTLDSLEFNGTDWVWCLLKNYGGNPSMDGRIANLASAIPQALASSEHMKGVGLISEATLDNPVVYQLLFDMAWYTESIDLDAWLDDYVVRRYGAQSESAREAWDILKTTVYNRQGNSTQIIARTPDNVGRTYPSQTQLRLEKALRLLIADFDLLSESEAYRYDLSELMRQIVSNYACYAHNEVYDAFNAGDLAAFKTAKEKFLSVFDIFNEVLSTEKDLLGGTWIGRAEDWAANYDDFSRDTLPFNAKALITTWAGRASAGALPDYGYRHYEGIVIDLYKTRWSLFLDKQEQYLTDGTEIVKTQSYFDFYWEWIMNTPEYSRVVHNEPSYMIALANRILDDYSVEERTAENVGNVAKDKKTTATAYYDTPGSNGGIPDNAVDGSLDTYWDGGDYSERPALTVDLGALYDLNRINVVNYYDGERYYQYELWASVDGVNYTKIAEKTSETAATQAGDSFGIFVKARYLRIVGTFDSANAAFHLRELRAYGSVAQAGIPGDVTGDGILGIDDVSALLDVLAGSLDENAACDVNGDAEVNIADVSALLDELAGT